MPQLYTCINHFHVSPSKIGNWSRNYSDYVSGPGNDATNHLMQRLKSTIPPLGKIGMYICICSLMVHVYQFIIDNKNHNNKF